VAEVDLKELERYLRIFQENPGSRVFAPLADLYRRLGKLSEAEDICREGIRRHPYYAGGRVALAHVLLEEQKYNEALQEADSVVTFYPDNLLARKILIRVLSGLGDLPRAEREYEALRLMAPKIATDPELTAALGGAATVPAGNAGSDRSLGTFDSPARNKKIQENTQWAMEAQQDLSPAIHRSQRLAGLLRRRLVLQSLIGKLTVPSPAA